MWQFNPQIYFLHHVFYIIKYIIYITLKFPINNTKRVGSSRKKVGKLTFSLGSYGKRQGVPRKRKLLLGDGDWWTSVLLVVMWTLININTIIQVAFCSILTVNTNSCSKIVRKWRRSNLVNYSFKVVDVYSLWLIILTT